MKPVILRETADRQNALLWSVRNLAGSRRDSISHRSKRTGISGRRCQIYGRSVWDFDYSRIGALAEKWEQQEITGEQTKDESNQSLEELDDMLNQNQSSLPMENNPLPHIEQLKKSGLISLVFPKEKQVSQKQIRGEEQASSRALR